MCVCVLTNTEPISQEGEPTHASEEVAGGPSHFPGREPQREEGRGPGHGRGKVTRSAPLRTH